MTRLFGRALALALLFGLAACSRKAKAPKALGLPEGDGVWFAEGIAAGDDRIEETLEAAGVAAVYLPARRIEPGGVPSVDHPAPPRPLARIPVVLVIDAGEDLLADADEKRAREFGAVLAREISAVLGRQAAFGPAGGMVLDLPFADASTEAYATALTEARSRLSNLLSREAKGSSARALPVAISMRRPRPADEDEQKALRALASRSDGIVAFVFGERGDADVAFVESLGKPWWAAYESGTTASVRLSSGQPGPRVPESALDALTDDPRTELIHELPWNEKGRSELTLRATRGVRIPGVSLSAGDSVVFSQPSMEDLLARFRADTSGRRLARGRIVVFAGGEDAGRIFPVAAMRHTIAGERPAPEVHGSIAVDGSRLVRVGAENGSPHASLVSRLNNWLEVDLAPARISDVEPGGFDRWETYDDRGRPVSPGRASRVRLYETLVAPFEQLEPARVRVRGRLPGGCCRIRVHVAPAAGGEVATDWGVPGAVSGSASPPPSP